MITRLWNESGQELRTRPKHIIKYVHKSNIVHYFKYIIILYFKLFQVVILTTCDKMLEFLQKANGRTILAEANTKIIERFFIFLTNQNMNAYR